eukprot:TRINITY_DN22469_c0_g1_i1.p1 TRINITY_DN22469_c0_g1~~TRINITY_DN22469_c0_g1_i1.p1  ORF type:complete len:434 (-),score=58.38 TRINITY_DN22469_c0_g1_i1:260-1369(-)
MAVVLSKPETHDKALAPNPKAFQIPKVKYVYGVATGVDAGAKTVALGDGSSVSYDVLIVATGFGMPLVYPKPGATLVERKAEVKQAGEAIRKAGTVAISGGGVCGLELAGDIRVAYPDKRIVVLCRDKMLKQFPEDTRKKASAACERMKIEILSGTAQGAPAEVSLEAGVLHVNEQVISYDVFLPMYSRGPNTSFLAGVPNLLDEKGNIKVNSFLQSEVHPEIFGIGVCNIDESYVGMAKLNGQWDDVASNVKAHLSGKPLKPHKESMPFMKVPPLLFIGHGKGGWASFDFAQMPPPVKCCCCCGLGGFPCCPPPCCYSICGPCACGYCCGKPEGEGTATSMAGMAFKSMGFHFKGVGQAFAPEQQSME